MSRVVIPTAGIGSRLGAQTKCINKSLVSVANRPVLTYLIEKFPKNWDFVIALGYKGELVKDFINLIYPDRKFKFINVNPYEGKGSGLGFTLLQCKEHLQQPFVFLSCDTIVKEKIIEPNENWVGYCDVDDSKLYRTIELRENNVSKLSEKGEVKNNSSAYIGLAGIKDYKLFWSEMTATNINAINKGESYGLNTLINKGNVKGYKYTWYDTGSLDGLNKANKEYRKNIDLNILEKENEAIWFIGRKVVKYSQDINFIKNRIIRAKYLDGFVPKVTEHKTNMYVYNKVKGEVLSKNPSIRTLTRLLKRLEAFWFEYELNKNDYKEFHKTNMLFYKDKSIRRINDYLDAKKKKDKNEVINGEHVPKIFEILNKIDWKDVSEGLPCRFHGDLHFENIIRHEKGNQFTLLDWRQDFGGNLVYGDIYYDYAKLNHGFIISHELVNKELYQIKIEGDKIDLDFHRKNSLVECEKYFKKYVLNRGHNYKKVKILTYLIYLNIATLHHDPYSDLLYYLGKFGLNETLKKYHEL